METIYIILGIVSTISIFLLGYLLNVIFNLKKQVDYLEAYLEDTDARIDIVVSKNAQQLKEQLDVLEERVTEDNRDIKSLLDSRLDKLEYKFRADVTSGIEVVKVIEASRKTNERLDEFIKTFQAQ